MTAAAVNAGPAAPAAGAAVGAPGSARDASRRHGRMARAWVLGLIAAVGIGIVNLWLVLTFVRQLFATLGMV